MKEIQKFEIFNNDNFGKVRTLLIDDEPWFVAKDVAEVLGYDKLTKLYSRIRKQDKREIDPQSVEITGSLHDGVTLSDQKIEPNPNVRRMIIINETGLYCAIFGSKLKKAKDFTYWVADEVLPSIRKTGAYMLPEILQKAINDPSYMDYILYLLSKDKANKLLITVDNVKLNHQYSKWVREVVSPYISEFAQLIGRTTDECIVASYKALAYYEDFDVYKERDRFITEQRKIAAENNIPNSLGDFLVPFMFIIWQNETMRLKYVGLIIESITNEKLKQIENK